MVGFFVFEERKVEEVVDEEVVASGDVLHVKVLRERLGAEFEGHVFPETALQHCFQTLHCNLKLREKRGKRRRMKLKEKEKEREGGGW